MKTSLNSARLGANNLSFLKFVDLASRHGFDGVDFGIGAAQRAAQELGGPDLLRDYLKEKHVAPAVWGLDVEWRKDHDTFEQGVGQLGDKARFARLIGATRCCTWMPPSVSLDSGEWDQMIFRRFAEVGRILNEEGIRFGLEWVGPHHLRAGAENAMGANAWIHTLPGTLDLIDRIGLPNIGLLVDSYHCYTTGVTEDELAALPDAAIVHVHINDAPVGVGPTGARDGERLLPGQGEINLSSFLNGLRRANYSGYVAAEILAPQNLAPTADEAAALVRSSLHGVGV